MVCTVLSQCYLQFAVTSSSLRSEHASLREVGKRLTGAKAEGPKQCNLCAGPPFIASVRDTNEKVPYIFIHL